MFLSVFFSDYLNQIASEVNLLLDDESCQFFKVSESTRHLLLDLARQDDPLQTPPSKRECQELSHTSLTAETPFTVVQEFRRLTNAEVISYYFT